MSAVEGEYTRESFGTRDKGKPKDLYALRRIRTGKTKKDKENGAHANRMKNRDARNEWCNNRNAKANQHPSGNK